MQARCAGTPSESAPARAARYVQLRSRSMWCASRLQVYRAAQSHWLAILTQGLTQLSPSSAYSPCCTPVRSHAVSSIACAPWEPPGEACSGQG